MSDEEKVVQLVREVMEKQIPLEPLGDRPTLPFSYYCPTCKTELSDGGYKPSCNYCENCGQRIKPLK